MSERINGYNLDPLICADESETISLFLTVTEFDQSIFREEQKFGYL